MNLSFKLIAFREFNNWKPEHVSKKLGLSLEIYEELEAGGLQIGNQTIEKLSALYNAPAAIFIGDNISSSSRADVTFTNCTFLGSSSSGYVNHQSNNWGTTQSSYANKEEIKNLKKHISQLLQQNNKLLTLLQSRLKGQ